MVGISTTAYALISSRCDLLYQVFNLIGADEYQAGLSVLMAWSLYKLYPSNRYSRFLLSLQAGPPVLTFLPRSSSNRIRLEWPFCKLLERSASSSWSPMLLFYARLCSGVTLFFSDPLQHGRILRAAALGIFACLAVFVTYILLWVIRILTQCETDMTGPFKAKGFEV